jgi:hypothetical protein
MVKESGSVAGQVLLLGGGYTKDQGMTSPVHLVDLATGVCTPQPNLLQTRDECAVACQTSASSVQEDLALGLPYHGRRQRC